ncbi:MAG: hypothetical protein PHC51_06115 [bacterium]|nr:hypothetical protein [bacterium]
MAKTSYMTTFCNTYGIWIARNLGIDGSSLNRFALGVFPAQRAEQVSLLLHSSAKKFRKFKFSDNHTADIDRLREFFGLKKAYIASRLDMIVTSFIMAAKRGCGLRQDGLMLIQFALNHIANAMENFEQPESMIRRAA